MFESLKDANRLPLFAVVAANLVAFYGVVQSDAIAGADWRAIIHELPEAAPAGLGLVLVGILNAQLPANLKARIVFGRWNNALPGSRAFTEYAHKDSRVDLDKLRAKLGELPTDPVLQNRAWYKFYKSIEDQPAVAQVHRDFLFTRDYACMALIMILLLGSVGLLQIPSVQTAWGYIGLLVLQFVLAWRAARNHGQRFVCTVLARKSAED